jgi:oligosaccharide repeat unit polymerase
MSSTIVFSGLIIAVVCFLATAAFGEVRSARGIFITFLLAGSILPFSLDYLTGIQNPTLVYPLVSPDGIKAAFLCVLALSIVVYVSLFVEKRGIAAAKVKVYGANTSVAGIFSALSIFFSVTYIGAMAIRLGGLTEMVVRLYQRVSLNDSVANTLTALYFASAAFAIFAFTFSRDCGSGKIRRFAIAAVAICVAQTLLLGGRSLVVLLGIGLFYVTLVNMKLKRFVIAGIIAMSMIATVSYVMTNLRFEAQNARVLTERADESFISRATTGLTFMDHFAASIHYVQLRGHDYGQLYVNALLLPIPRDLWPGKPLQISVRFRDFLFGDTLGGAPPGLLGEGYIAFGTIGVILASIVMGWMIGRIDVTTVIASRSRCRMREAAAGILAPQVAYAIVRGGFDIGVLRVGIPAFWCLVCWQLAAYLIKRQPRITFSDGSSILQHVRSTVR